MITDEPDGNGLVSSDSFDLPEASHVAGFQSGFKYGFRVLYNRNYRLYWISQVVSLTGNWMQLTAQSWLVLHLTKSPLALGWVSTLQFLPLMLLCLFGGVLADRLPKRKTLMFTQTAALVQSLIFGMLVVTNQIQIWHIYVLAFMLGLVNAIDDPMREAFVGEMVERHQLSSAIALNTISFNGARSIGPAIAGLLIAQFGVSASLFLNATSFIAVLIALLSMKRDSFIPLPVIPRQSFIGDLVDGMKYIGHTRPVFLAFIPIAAIGTFGFNFIVMMPLLATFVLHMDAASFGILSTFVGLGSVSAAFGVAYLRDVSKQRVIISGALYSLLLAAVAITPIFALSAVLLFALGFASSFFSTAAGTLLQLHVDPAVRGRVMSWTVWFYMGSKPISSFMLGSLSNLFGVSIALIACAALCLAGVMGMIGYDRYAKPPVISSNPVPS